MTQELAQTYAEGVVNQILTLGTEKSKLHTRIQELEEIIHQSQEWSELQELKVSLVEAEKSELSLREQAKNEMLARDIKKIQLLNGMTVQLDSTPGALKIEDESKVPEEYFKEKITKSVDKVKLKEDIKQGVYVEGVTIEQWYNFVIKS